jgi:excinuclease ABC subunit C
MLPVKIIFTVKTQLESQLKNLPDSPGIYLFKDVKGTVIYVGKAASLKQRIKSYFSTSSNISLKTSNLSSRIYKLEYIVTSSEQEALVLECSLIKKIHPRYNARLKDDKTFPYIKITINEDWPGVYITRQITEKGARYFGPFPSAGSVRKTLRMIKKIFLFRSCLNYIDGKSQKPCLEYYIHQCLGPCIGAVSKEEYRDVINQVILFLEGRQELVLKMLYSKLETAIERLEFEKAASLRDQIQSAQKVIEGHKIAIELKGDQDVIALAQNEEQAYVEVFFIRSDKFIGHDHFIMDGIHDESQSEVMTGFIKQYYSSASYIPSALLLQHPVNEIAILVDWLEFCKGSKVKIQVPKRGAKKQLINMVARNAANGLLLLKVKRPKKDELRIGLLELKAKFDLPGIPFRIECYDISNIQGASAVGSMVVLEGGLPKPRQYRRFRIKTTVGQNDYAMIQEVLRRRLFKAMPLNRSSIMRESRDSIYKPESYSKNSLIDSSWKEIPDLILIDGGKGQLNAALEIILEVGASISLASLAKENEDIFIPNNSNPVNLLKDSAALHILQAARDEAHRFAVNYHRKVRQRESMASILEDVSGIGPKRRKLLLKRFGSITAIKNASVTEICQTGSISMTLAKKIKEYC